MYSAYNNVSGTLKPLAGLLNSVKQLAQLTFPVSDHSSYYSSRSSIKIVILGDPNVNKTKLLENYAAEFQNQSEVKIKVGCADRWRYEIQLTAKDYSQTILSEVNDIEHADFTLTGASACIICFSLTSRISWKHAVNNWLPVCRQYCEGVPVLFLGTNSDERDQISKRLKNSKQRPNKTKHKKEEGQGIDKELKGGETSEEMRPLDVCDVDGLSNINGGNGRTDNVDVIKQKQKVETKNKQKTKQKTKKKNQRNNERTSTEDQEDELRTVNADDDSVACSDSESYCAVTINDIPSEVFLRVMDFLKVKDIYTMMLVSRLWHRIATQDYVWLHRPESYISKLEGKAVGKSTNQKMISSLASSSSSLVMCAYEECSVKTNKDVKRAISKAIDLSRKASSGWKRDFDYGA